MVIAKAVHFCSVLVKRTADSVKTWRSANVFKMSNIEHFPHCGMMHYVAVKTKELTLKQIFSVPCPTCGAAIEEACELNTGTRRNEPHRDRKLSAAEAMERSQSKQY